MGANAWHVLPPRDDADDVESFRLRVVEAEHPEMHKRWKDHEAIVRRRDGSAAAKDVHNDWEFILDHVYRNGGSPSSPPPIEPTSTPPPSNPLEHSERLIHEARKLGFGDVDIPGVWTFLSTISTGGQGRMSMLHARTTSRLC